ncbi:MAG: cytidylate kinase-like family protein [Bacteroidota bacterium]|nr:cytidylate kinase-like family protein [Bacteroidota bacterium]
MKNLLIDYFRNRMDKEHSEAIGVDESGPLITLSRDYGCPGKNIATMISNEIQKKYGQQWKMISKEILETLAKELHLNPSVVQDLANFEDRRLTDYIALLLSKDYYPGEIKIKKTLCEIILSFANKGNTIIVGRAGFYISKHINRSFHIKLYAPIEWRIDYMSEKRGLSYPDAMKLVEEMSHKREQFLNYFAIQKKKDVEFDALYDCSLLSSEQIVSKVMTELEQRNILE